VRTFGAFLGQCHVLPLPSQFFQIVLYRFNTGLRFVIDDTPQEFKASIREIVRFINDKHRVPFPQGLHDAADDRGHTSLLLNSDGAGDFRDQDVLGEAGVNLNEKSRVASTGGWR
jgi:hypothetical protein